MVIGFAWLAFHQPPTPIDAFVDSFMCVFLDLDWIWNCTFLLSLGENDSRVFRVTLVALLELSTLLYLRTLEEFIRLLDGFFGVKY